jgi:hypothetical protein
MIAYFTLVGLIITVLWLIKGVKLIKSTTEKYRILNERLVQAEQQTIKLNQDLFNLRSEIEQDYITLNYDNKNNLVGLQRTYRQSSEHTVTTLWNYKPKEYTVVSHRRSINLYQTWIDQVSKFKQDPDDILNNTLTAKSQDNDPFYSRVESILVPKNTKDNKSM